MKNCPAPTPAHNRLARRRGHLVTVGALLAVALMGFGRVPAGAAAVSTGPGAASTAAGGLTTAATTGGLFTALPPHRLLDTRSGVGAPAAKVGARATLALQVTGRGGVPATGVAAVVLNVTVTGPSRQGHLTVYGAGASRPDTSNLNFTAWQTVANVVVSPVGSNGKVAVHNGSSGSSHLVADVEGYYASGVAGEPGAFQPLAPARVLDSRAGVGAPVGKVAPNATLPLQVLGAGGVPPSGVSAVFLNVTVTEPAIGGHLTVHADGTAVPDSSNINFEPGRTVANLVLAPMGGNGKVALENASGGTTHLVADVAGYVLAGTPTQPGALRSLTPARLLDTRSGLGATQATVAPGASLRLQVGGRGGVPTTRVAAVVLTVTVTATTRSGYLTAYVDGTARPTASNLNFVGGQTVANLVVVPLSANGRVDLYNGSTGSTHLVADVSGFVVAAPTTQPQGPTDCVPRWSSSARFGSWTDAGHLVNNNMWSEDAGPQTITACSWQQWSVTSNQGGTGTDDGVKTYADTQTHVNHPLGALSSLPSTFDVATPAGGGTVPASGKQWNAAYDLWLDDYGTEVMVWNNWTMNWQYWYRTNGGVDVTIDGVLYHAYRNSGHTGLWFIRDQVTNRGSVDLGHVLAWAVAKGWLRSSQVLGEVEYGFEVAYTGSPTVFTLNAYTL